MPYISQEARTVLAKTGQISTVGELNYVITKMMKKYIDDNGGESYTMYNSLIGVLECVKSEFYRRLVSEYEDVKCDQHGDVY